MDITRPNLTFDQVTLDVYNSRVYVAGKHTWDPITLNVRDDVYNEVTKLVCEQLQKQFDFFEQSSAASGIDYKFTGRIEMLDGGNGADTANILETYELYGCYLDNVQYGQLAYATSDPVQIQLSVKYDNAIQTPRGTGIGTAVARAIGTAATGS